MFVFAVFVAYSGFVPIASTEKECYLISFMNNGLMTWAMEEAEHGLECTQRIYSPLELLPEDLLLIEKPRTILTTRENVQEVLNKTDMDKLFNPKRSQPLSLPVEKGMFGCRHYPACDTTSYPPVEAFNVNTLTPICCFAINHNCSCQEALWRTLQIFACYCSEDVNTHTCYRLMEGCDQLRSYGKNESGTYVIQTPLEMSVVYCDMDTDNGGWTVFQRRVSGDLDFKRNWSEYASGFGKLISNVWLGNEILYQMTGNARHVLRIDMETPDGRNYTATYDNFKIGNASKNYRLMSLGTFSGTNGLHNDMACHENMDFSTYDNDNDLNVNVNCAAKTCSGWWMNGGFGRISSCKNGHCEMVNLNGEYTSDFKKSSIVWEEEYISFSEMKIRPYQY